MSALSGTAVIAIAAMSLPGSINIAAHSAASHMKCRYIFFARVRIVVIRAIMVAMDAIVNSAHNAEYIFNPNGASAANVARDGRVEVVMPSHRHVQIWLHGLPAIHQNTEHMIVGSTAPVSAVIVSRSVRL